MKKILNLAFLSVLTLGFVSCTGDDDSPSVSDSIEANGGTLSGGPYAFVVQDGNEDKLTDLALTGNSGDNSTFVITTSEGIIVGLPPTLEAVTDIDFDGETAGACVVWHLSYNDDLAAPELNDDANDLGEGYSLSNGITFVRTINGELTLNLDGLEELGDDYVYEGWVIVDGAPVTTGTFTSVDFPQTFEVDQETLDSATMFVLSIEPAIDPDPAPAATKILSGAFDGDSADVDSSVQVADFSESYGKYILATPTDGDTTNEYSGVWFLDNSGESPVAGLSLPDLAAGWAYEGWVVINGTPVSTGTFTSASGADSNANSATYGPGGGPGYPGEDFLMGSFNGVDFPTDLRGNMVVISVEPVPDDSTAPFVLKPLATTIPSDAMTHAVLDIPVASGPVTSLSGTVTK